MKVVVIGGVAGGASAAARLRRLDEKSEIVLFERGANVSFANCGLPYHLGGVIEEREALLLMLPERFKGRLNVDLRLRHEVTAIDRTTKQVHFVNHETGATGTESYDKLLLAPGSSPLRPPLPGINDPKVHSLWTLEDMDAIQNSIAQDARHAIVVGGGFIGLETAENLRHRGLEVTLIELLPQVMPTIDPEFATLLHSELENNGIQLKLKTAVMGFARNAQNALVVTLDSGEELTADFVVLSIGVRPNSELARAAGLTVGERGGIQTDALMCTNDPDIYAVGDAVQVADPIFGGLTQIPLAGPANRQGRLAADAMMGENPIPYPGTWGSSIVKLFDLTAASTGATEKRLQRAGTAYRKLYLHPFSHVTYYPGAYMMHLKLLFDDNGRILGAQLVGREGIENSINVIATAMQAGLTVQDLARLELAYAPPFGAAKSPVNFAGFMAENTLSGKSRPIHVENLTAAYTLLDVCDPHECACGIIPGALTIPLGQLRQRLDEIPRDNPLVVYCAVGLRGYIAERLLRAHGFDVQNLCGGITLWRMYQKIV